MVKYAKPFEEKMEQNYVFRVGETNVTMYYGRLFKDRSAREILQVNYSKEMRMYSHCYTRLDGGHSERSTVGRDEWDREIRDGLRGKLPSHILGMIPEMKKQKKKKRRR